METLQNDNQEQLTLDTVLSEREAQKADQIELMHSLEVPEELEAIRAAADGVEDQEVTDKIKEFSAVKLQEKGGDFVEEQGINAIKLKEKYGDDVIGNIRDFYLDYITMPQEQFDQRMKELKEAQSKANAEPKGENKSGVYGYQGKDLVNNSIDILGVPPRKPSTELAPVTSEEVEPPHPEYDGPVNDGMEIELASSQELVPREEENDSFSEIVPTPVDDAETPENDEGDEKRTIRDRIRDRWNDIRVRGRLLAAGDIRGALGDEEGKLLNKKRMLGTVATVGIVAFAWQNNKHGWGVDVIPFADGDGFDLNPFNNSPDGASEVVDAAPAPEAPAPEVEMTTVRVDPSEGTSHIARDTLGINFDSVDQWNEFNAATNPLFEGVDGFYKDPTTGQWFIDKPGTHQIPQAILEEMQRKAQEINTRS